MREDLSELHLSIFNKDNVNSWDGSDMLKILPSRVNDKLFETTVKNIVKADPSYDYKNFYKLNSHGLRSDEFLKTHEGMHILFAGCSQTFGAGTRIEDLWAYKIYKKISESHKTSGFFNIAISGITISGIISQIFSYFSKIGYPDYLFINIPDFSREVGGIFIKGSSNMDTCGSSVNTKMLSRQLVTQYQMLLNVCKSNGVKVYAMSWYSSEWIELNNDYDPTKYFTGMYIPKNSEMLEHCNNFINDNSRDTLAKYHLTALDGVHQGIAFQDFWYTKMYQMYMEDR